jgi:L-rhamnose mutarotase
METGGPPLPLIADGEPNWVNAFSTPLLIEADNTHEWMKRWYVHPPVLETDRTCMYGGMDDTYVVFYVPNQQRQNFWQKQIWIQMAYFARKDGVRNYDVFIARDPNFLYVNDIYLTYEQLEELDNEPQGNTGKWYRLTAVYRMDDQPAEEYIELWAYNDPAPAMAASMIDQVDIDTRSVNLDMFKDGCIDLCDYAVLAANYHTQNPDVDLHPDGYVDEKDLSVLLQRWLQQDSSQ